MEQLDKFDLAILAELQNDGRLSNTELAARVGLSTAPCWRRVGHWRTVAHQGLPRRDRPADWLGRAGLCAADAERNTGDSTRALEEAIQKLPQIVSCHYISGSGTFELQVICQDLDSFSRFARESLINLPHVKDLHTSFSLGEVKASSALPLNHLQPVS
jgi:DNA-binding Lrp family transcriptional regulator